MLNVYFGPMPEAIYNTAVYFRNTYEDKWITAPLAVEMTRDVDRSSTVYGYAHALYGRIHPKELPHNTAAHSQRDLLRSAGGAFSDAQLVL